MKRKVDYMNIVAVLFGIIEIILFYKEPKYLLQGMIVGMIGFLGICSDEFEERSKLKVEGQKDVKGITLYRNILLSSLFIAIILIMVAVFWKGIYFTTVRGMDFVLLGLFIIFVGIIGKKTYNCIKLEKEED